MTKWLSLALAFAFTLGLGIWQLQRENDAKMQVLRTEVKRLAEAGAQASARAEQVERTMPTLTRTTLEPAAASPNAAPPASAAVAEAQEVSDPGPSLEEQMNQVESAFELQPVDMGWARATQGELSQQLGKQLGTSVLESLECRENLCKAHLRHQDAAAHSAFIDRLIGNANDVWKGAIVYYRDIGTAQDDRVGMSIYFAKEGTEPSRL